MADLPARITIHEEGPREGFQIEANPIPVADKVRLIEALAETGLPEIQCTSFVNPVQVPQMADAEQVAAAIRRRPGVRYTTPARMARRRWRSSAACSRTAASTAWSSTAPS